LEVKRGLEAARSVGSGQVGCIEQQCTFGFGIRGQVHELPVKSQCVMLQSASGGRGCDVGAGMQLHARERDHRADEQRGCAGSTAAAAVASSSPSA
jgi:hypothetical protein